MLLALVAAPAVGESIPELAAEVDWRVAEPDYAWSFPDDHWAHREYKIEWWYLTGHLEAEDDPTRRFGYQFTIFRVGLSPTASGLESEWAAGALVMGHAALTDKGAGDHRFSELLRREASFLAGFGEPGDPRIAWSRAPVGTDDVWEIVWNQKAFDFRMRDDRVGIAFDLSTTPAKPRIFQGAGGFSRKSDAPGAASLYYSYTRLTTTGSVTIDGEPYRVRGESWMDKEFSSSQLTDDQVGWDWFSLQLDDGREIMLYELRNEDGKVDHGRGTVVSREAETRYLRFEDWKLRTTGRWRSPESGIEYPAGWVIELEGEASGFVLEPDVADQENRSRLAAGPSYWEGSVTVRDENGVVLGRGYVEMTGYGENNRPPI
jgi:predicted secreted hydrolase